MDKGIKYLMLENFEIFIWKFEYLFLERQDRALAQL